MADKQLYLVMQHSANPNFADFFMVIEATSEQEALRKFAEGGHGTPVNKHWHIPEAQVLKLNHVYRV